MRHEYDMHGNYGLQDYNYTVRVDIDLSILFSFSYFELPQTNHCLSFVFAGLSEEIQELDIDLQWFGNQQSPRPVVCDLK